MSRLWLLLLPLLVACTRSPPLQPTPPRPISIAPPLAPPADLVITPPALPGLPPITSRRLPNGLRLVTIERPRSPLTRVDLVIRHGAYRQPEVAALTDRLLAYGPRGQSEQQFRIALDNLGAALDISTGLLTSRLSLTVQPADLAAALRLLASLVKSPALPAGFLDYETNLLKVRQRSGEASSAWLASAFFYRIAYPADHPLRAAGVLDRESLDGLRHEMVRDYAACALRPVNMSLLITGPVNPDVLLRQPLDLWTDKIAPGNGEQCNGPARTFPSPALRPDTAGHGLRIHIVDRRHSAQVDFRIGWPTVDRTHPDWLPLTLLAKLLDGASGRLFLDLRERQGLAYHINARQSVGLFASPFSVATASRPQHAAAMLKGILAHLDKLGASPTSPADLARLRQQITGELNLLYEEDRRLANRIILTLLAGEEPEQTDRVFRQLGELTGEDLQQTARRWLGSAPVIVLVGERRQLEPQLRQAFPEAELTFYKAELTSGARRQTGFP